MGIKNVHAQTASFYEGEYIDGIYMNKHQFSTKTIYYQKARIFRKKDTHELAYCAEPFAFFEDNSEYISTLNPANLTNEQLERMKKIAYFGYGYGNHTDLKWYAITQMMIWKSAESNGDYYFTDSLNGNRISPYQQEMQEIENLIQSSSTLPSFANQTYTTVVGTPLTITDQHNVLPLFQNNQDVVVEGNQVTFFFEKPGVYEYHFTKEYQNYSHPWIFYQSNHSQALLQTGNLEKLDVKVTIKAIETSIEISKIDQDTKSIVPSGDGILDGAKYALYDENFHKVRELIIEENQALVKNINFGTYYLQEIEAGVGYTINPEKIKITLTEENPKVSLVLENKIIEKEITIEKKYGEKDSYQSEKNITFEIWKEDEFIDRITTNEEGIAKIKLPFGTYKFIQQNTTEGYEKVDPITLEVKDSKEERLQLKDIKIEVPDTFIRKFSFLRLFLWILFL